MGYELHITRARFWAENAKHRITSEEWLAFVEKDPELEPCQENGPYFAKWSGKSGSPEPWLDWADGNIYAKYPVDALINKMVAIAHELHAQVQGDDGEIYTSGHKAPIHPKPSILDWLRARLRKLHATPRIKRMDVAFKVGDRVLDVFRKEATVVEIEPESNHGLGKATIRYEDGRVASFILGGSGLTIRPNTNNNK